LVNAQEEYVLAIKQGIPALKAAAEQRLRALEVPESLIKQLENGGSAAMYVTFYAPISGVVQMLNIQNGFYVTPGMTLFSIADNKRLQIDAQLLGDSAHQLRVGAPVTVTPLENSLPKKWIGQIAQIYPEVSSLTRKRQFRVALQVDTSELLPQQWVKMDVQGPLPQERLMIPSNAVIRSGDKTRVVVETSPDKFRSIDVTTGQVIGGYTEVVRGLEENSKVVVSGQFLIDSESSISAEFMRMQDNQEDRPPYQSATVNGDIIEVNTDSKAVLIHRDAIPKWGRAAATVDFMVDQSLDIDRFISGQRIRFTFEVRDELVITDVSSVEEEHGHAH
jgi:Cu(I)/Ag(I) efflux system membrane fusion protein